MMRPKHDKKKQKKLEFAGFAASWFEDDDVFSDVNTVNHKIETTIDKSEDQNEIPPPNPSSRGGQSRQRGQDQPANTPSAPPPVRDSKS